MHTPPSGRDQQRELTHAAAGSMSREGELLAVMTMPRRRLRVERSASSHALSRAHAPADSPGASRRACRLAVAFRVGERCPPSAPASSSVHAPSAARPT